MKSLTSRRQFLCYSMLGLAGLANSSLLKAKSSTFISSNNLVLDTKHNIEIPIGSSLRIIAESTKPVINNYLWHSAPDGGACFATQDNGWIYVSNSELKHDAGGVSAVRFDANANIVDAYSILQNTTRNCAGGKTPWNTWLSCEEHNEGLVYECDPIGKQAAVAHPQMGAFNHEAAAFDPKSGSVYLTEDTPDGCLYRYKPTSKNDLSEGVLEVAVLDKQVVKWQKINDPLAQTQETRYQVQEAARFKGGEGIVYSNRQIFFTTKIDNIVWQYHIDTGLLSKVYDAANYETPLLTGVDNIEVTPSGELLVAEDGGDMQIIALDYNFNPHVLIAIHGQDDSEITGPAFSPDGTRLYFSSQRGVLGKKSGVGGITYELSL